MNLQTTSKLALALVMLLVGWSLLPGAGLAGYWRSLTGITEERISDLKEAYGLDIHYGQGTSSLPRVWQLPPVAGQATPANAACVADFMPVIQAELQKYRPATLQSHFQNLYLYKALELFDVSYGATVQGSDIYLTLDCQAGYSETDVAKALHHELSSLLLGTASFPAEDWSAANEGSFRYLDNDEQVLAAVSTEQSLMGTAEVHRQGFLADYGKTTLENDFNLYAEVAMVEPERLADLASKYPRVAVKARLLRDFYRSFVNDDFLETFSVIGNNARSAKVPEVHTTIGNLETWIALPVQPDSVKWVIEPAVPSTGNDRLTVPGPTDYGVTALLRFSPGDYEEIVGNSERVNAANDVVVNPEFYEAWVPEDVKAELKTRTHADGESVIMVGRPAYQAEQFINREGGSPLIHGSIYPLGKGYIVVSLYTM